MCADSTFRRYLTACRRCALSFVGIGLITLAVAPINIAPAAAQTGSKDTEATQEEEALEELLEDEEDIQFKQNTPPPGATGGNNWNDPASGQDPQRTPVDPDQIITSPGVVDPNEGTLGKEEKNAARIYVDGELEQRLARVAGRVPDDEIDHHVVYTPSPAARKNPNLEAFERRLWKQRLAEYKQSKLADRLLKDLDGAAGGSAGGTAPNDAGNPPPASGGGGSRASGESGNSQSGSFLERLFGAGGAGGNGQQGSNGQPGKGAGRETGGDGKSDTADEPDRPAGGATSPGQGDTGGQNGTSEAPLGTVALGDPPPAHQGQSSAFDEFVANSGLLGQQNAATDPATNGSGSAQPADAGAGTTGAGGGQVSGVPKPKPRPVTRPGTASVAASSGSTGQASAASVSAGTAAGLPNPPSSSATAAPTPGTQGVEVGQATTSGSPSATSAGEQGSTAPTSPLTDLLAAANAALDRAGPQQTVPGEAGKPPESAGQSAAPVEDTRAPAPPAPPGSASAEAPDPGVADTASGGASGSPADSESELGASAPDATADQTNASARSFADRYSFSREIAALSSASSEAPPDNAETSAATVASGEPDSAAPNSDAPADLSKRSVEAVAESEQNRLQRREFERVAMEKFLANEALTTEEQAFIEAAREASSGKSEDQVNEQLRTAAKLENSAAGIREDVEAIARESEINNKLSYLEPAGNGANPASQAVQAGGQTIMVATNSASGRTIVQGPDRATDTVQSTSEPDGDETVKLFRPETQKSMKPEEGAADGATPSVDQVGAKSDRDLQRDRQTQQSERLARKLERQARQETTRFRFDNCILFIFCNVTKVAPPDPSADQSELGAAAGSDDGDQ